MSTRRNFDVIVIGVGSMGASACYYLAANGAKVLGIEQFDLPHERGSHAGQSRIVRKAYFEHPDYVPLLQRAYQNWDHLEAITGEQVFFRTGLLYAGPSHHPIMQGVRLASATYGIPIEEIGKTEIESAYRALNLPSSGACIMEPDAGFVTPEKTIRLYVAKAKELGAEIRTNTKVIEWKDTGTGFEVSTTEGLFRAQKLVITAGAWASQVLPSLHVPLVVTKQVLAWVQPREAGAVALGNFPCWMIADDTTQGCFYGFPLLPAAGFDGPQGFKLALHYPGTPCHPDGYDQTVHVEDQRNIQHFLSTYFPGLYVGTNALKTCLYTNSPDEHFIIDYLPGFEKRIAVAAGFSGHGFKFVPVVGELLSDLVLKGATELPAGFLGIDRFG